MPITTDLNQVIWFLPKPKETLFITIPNQTCINFSQHLLPLMPQRIAIGAWPDGRLCIKQHHDGHKLPKSGSVKNVELISYIVEAKIKLPARYTVRQEDDHWIATPQTPPSVPKSSKLNLPKVSPKKHKNFTAIHKELDDYENR